MTKPKRYDSAEKPRGRRSQWSPELVDAALADETLAATVLPLRRAPGPAISPTTACAQFVASRAAQNCSEETLRGYRSVLRLLCRYLEADQDGRQGKTDLWDVTADDLNAWLLSLRSAPSERTGKRLSAYSVQNYGVHLLAAWHWFIERGLAPATALRGVQAPRVQPSQRKQPVTFTESEVETLLKSCAEGEEGDERIALTLRNRALVAMFLDSGVRLSECLSMRVDTLDLSKLTVRVEASKTRVRTVGVGQHLAARYLREYVQRARPYLVALTAVPDVVGLDYGPLWLNRDGYPLLLSGVEQIFTRIKRRAGMSGQVSPHKARRYWITSLLRAGVPLPIVAEQAGTSPEVIARNYWAPLQDETLHATQAASPLDAWARQQALDQSGAGGAGRRRRVVDDLLADDE